MRVERMIMRIARMMMRGDLQKTVRGEQAAKAPDKSQVLRQAMRLMRRSGRL